MIAPLPPAPGESEHPSITLANSAVTMSNGQELDDLGSPKSATAWLAEHDFIPTGTALLAYCQTRLTTLRTNLQSLFGAQIAGQAPSALALDFLNLALTSTPTVPLLQPAPGGGFVRTTPHPTTQLVEHALARLAEDAASLLSGEHASLLSQCTAAPCDRFFLRTHANRHWCSTRCGDRVRAARAYARRQHSRGAS